jgi:hypothetical protein
MRARGGTVRPLGSLKRVSIPFTNRSGYLNSGNQAQPWASLAQPRRTCPLRKACSSLGRSWSRLHPPVWPLPGELPVPNSPAWHPS